MQAFEQALTVQSNVHFFGVDHDVIKECIDRRAQCGQSLQGAGVVARIEQGLRLGQQTLHHLVQSLLSRLFEQRWIHMRIDFVRLFQNIANALIGRGQCRAFRQSRKCANRR